MDTAEVLHMLIHNSYDSMHEFWESSSQTNSSMEGEGGHEVSTLAEELLAMLIFRERESLFFFFF